MPPSVRAPNTMPCEEQSCTQARMYDFPRGTLTWTGRAGQDTAHASATTMCAMLTSVRTSQTRCPLR
jgi:hypothetical protein